MASNLDLCVVLDNEEGGFLSTDHELTILLDHTNNTGVNKLYTLTMDQPWASPTTLNK